MRRLKDPVRWKSVYSDADWNLDPQMPNWLRIERELLSIMRRLCALGLQYPSFDEDLAKRVLMKLATEGTLHRWGPFVSAGVALMVTLRKGRQSYTYEPYEAWALKVMAPWVAARWNKGQPADLARIEEVSGQMKGLLHELFPKRKRDRWLDLPQPRIADKRHQRVAVRPQAHHTRRLQMVGGRVTLA